jgi:hypothetical protein
MRLKNLIDRQTPGNRSLAGSSLQGNLPTTAVWSAKLRRKEDGCAVLATAMLAGAATLLTPTLAGEPDPPNIDAPGNAPLVSR